MGEWKQDESLEFRVSRAEYYSFAAYIFTLADFTKMILNFCENLFIVK